jgi:uncharacterized phage infection (PIP) family protein YhgE
MAAITHLIAAFYAVVEVLISGRSRQEVLQQLGVEPADFAAASRIAEGYTWRGQFTAALIDQSRGGTPQIVSQLRQLAALEHHYDILMFQFQRAEKMCTQIRQAQHEIREATKADKDSFRIAQAAARILRDIAKAEIRLEKTLAAKEEQISTIAKSRQKFEIAPPPVVSQPESSESQSSESKNSESQFTESNAIESAASDVQDISLQPTEPFETEERAAVEESPPLPAEPMSKEHAAILERHRQRIKNALPKDRPGLIAKILDLEKAKSLSRAA